MEAFIMFLAINDPPKVQMSFKDVQEMRLKFSVGSDEKGFVRCDEAAKFGYTKGVWQWSNYNPTTRYYSTTWNQTCPNGRCNR